MVLSGALALYVVDCAVGHVGDERTAVELPLLAPAVEQLDVLVAVQLEVPVRVRGEPVVVAAVQDHGVVIADTLVRQQLRELLLVDEVALDLILEFGLPVQPDGACDVAALVGGGVFVDLDEDGVGCIEIALGPVGGDQDVGASHGVDPFGCLVSRYYAGFGERRRRATSG